MSSAAVATVKDTRDTLRARKIVMKGHERSKNVAKHVRAATKAAGPVKRGAALLLDDQEDFSVPGLVVQRTSQHKKKDKDLLEAELPSTSGSDTDTHGPGSLPTEVPILTMLRTSQPWDGVGADFELISNPGDHDVIALEEDDFADLDDNDDDWENVVDEEKVLAAKKNSYASALKNGLKDID